MAFSVVGGLSGCEAGLVDVKQDAQFSPVSLKSRVSMGGWSAEEDDGDKEDKDQVKRPVARKSTTAVRKQEPSATTKWEYEGQTFKTEIDPPPRIKFRQHNCSTK